LLIVLFLVIVANVTFFFKVLKVVVYQGYCFILFSPSKVYEFIGKIAEIVKLLLIQGRYLLIVLFLVIVANVTIFFKDIVLDNNLSNY
jgi:hypothetical protein